jgi:hypothetical protein
MGSMHITWPVTGFTSALRQVGAAVEAGSPSLAAMAPASAAIAARLAAKASPVKTCLVTFRMSQLLDCQPTP